MAHDGLFAHNSGTDRRVAMEILYCMSTALPGNNSFVPWLVYSLPFYHIIYIYISKRNLYIYINFKRKNIHESFISRSTTLGFKFQKLPRTGGLLIHSNLKCIPDGTVHRRRQDVKN